MDCPHSRSPDRSFPPSLPYMSLAGTALGPISRELDAVTPIHVVPVVVNGGGKGGGGRKLTPPTADLLFHNKARRVRRRVRDGDGCGLCLSFCPS